MRDLMRRELDSGRYGALSRLAGMADGVAALLAQHADDAPPVGSEASPDSAGGPEGRPKAAPSAKKPAKAKKPGRKSKYPFFVIKDGWIEKVAWSKKSKDEYRHYAACEAAVALAEHIDSTQRAGRIWSVEALGGVPHPSGDGVLPGYQIYLLIAWMRSLDLIVKQGRSGYSAAGSGALAPRVRQAVRG